MGGAVGGVVGGGAGGLAGGVVGGVEGGLAGGAAGGAAGGNVGGCAGGGVKGDGWRGGGELGGRAGGGGGGGRGGAYAPPSQTQQASDAFLLAKEALAACAPARAHTQSASKVKKTAARATLLARYKTFRFGLARCTIPLCDA